MNVNFNGETYSFEVRPGPDGYRDFTRRVGLGSKDFGVHQLANRTPDDMAMRTRLDRPPECAQCTPRRLREPRRPLASSLAAIPA